MNPTRVTQAVYQKLHKHDDSSHKLGWAHGLISVWGGGLCGGPNSQFIKLVHIGNFLSLSAVNTYLSKKIVLFHINVVQKVSKSPWTPTLTPTKTEPHTDPHTLIIACGVGRGGAPPPHHKKPHKPHTRCPPQLPS
jgi:hypothetical protein